MFTDVEYDCAYELEDLFEEAVLDIKTTEAQVIEFLHVDKEAALSAMKCLQFLGGNGKIVYDETMVPQFAWDIV